MEAKAASMAARLDAYQERFDLADLREQEVAALVDKLVRAEGSVHTARLDGVEARVEAGERREAALGERLDRLMLLMLGTLLTAFAGLIVQVVILVAKR